MEVTPEAVSAVLAQLGGAKSVAWTQPIPFSLLSQHLWSVYLTTPDIAMWMTTISQKKLQSNIDHISSLAGNMNLIFM